MCMVIDADTAIAVYIICKVIAKIRRVSKYNSARGNRRYPNRCRRRHHPSTHNTHRRGRRRPESERLFSRRSQLNSAGIPIYTVAEANDTINVHTTRMVIVIGPRRAFINILI